LVGIGEEDRAKDKQSPAYYINAWNKKFPFVNAIEVGNFHFSYRAISVLL